MKRFYSVSFLLLVSIVSLAQTGTIKGSVRSLDGKPAAMVNVLLKGTNLGSTTDDTGKFIFKNVKPGTYTLQVSFVGFKTTDKEVAVEDGVVHNIDVVLQEDATQLSEILIMSTKSMNEATVTIGKSPIQAFDLPQSVVSLNLKVLEEQQTLRVSDVLKNVSGVYTMGTTGGTQEEIAGRGFAFGSNNTFKNGVRFNNAVMPEISAFESVEILKGSNAILFGNVSAGGVMNLVTKKPKFESGGQISFRAGSYNFYKPSIDIYGPLNNSNTVAYRLNASYETAESFRDGVSSERFYINPSVLLNLSEETTLLVESDYLKDERTPDYGIGAINYQIADVPRNRFLGTSWANYAVIQKSLTVTANHQLNSNWGIKVTGGAQGFESDLFSNARPTTIQPDGTWNRNLQRTGIDETYLIGQADLTGTFKTGILKHTLLVGGDIDRYNTQNNAYNIYASQATPNKISVAYDRINVYDLTMYEQRSDIPRVKDTTMTVNVYNRAGFYVQDFVEISQKLKVLAGVRYSYIETENTGYKYTSPGVTERNGTPIQRFDDAITPRFGVVYQPIKSLAAFASYANSFNLNTGSDINFKPLAPSMLDQYEVGVKNEFMDGLISANITAYKIINSNQSQSVFPAPISPLNAAAQELAGEVTSQGVEVDVMTKSIKGFSFIAGYSYNHTKYTKSNIYEVGSRLRYNPAHTANLSTQYTVGSSSVLKGLNAGFTLFYVADMVAGRSTRLTVENDNFKLIPLPSFLQVDASIGYTYNKASIRFRLTNVTDVLGYYAHDDNSINPIAPRQFATTLSYKL